MSLNPFFSVERKPAVVEINGSYMEIGKDVLVNTETQGIVGVVGPNYKLVENQEVANLFGEVFAESKIDHLKDHLNGGTSLWRREIVLADDRHTVEIKKGDILKTMVTIGNGYDAKTAVQFEVSALRLICTNGMKGWSKQFGGTVSHVNRDVIGQIRSRLESLYGMFGRNFALFRKWTEMGFTREQFNLFIDARVKSETNKDGYLSKKQADAIKDRWMPIMEQYKENDNVWGSYNVLTAIASHETRAKQGSHLFSTGFKRMSKLTEDFYGAMARQSGFLELAA